MRHPDAEVGDTAHFRAMLGRLWAVGAEFDREKLWAGRPRRVPLPTYPFQHSPYWIEPGRLKAIDDRDLLRPLRASSRNDWFWSPRWIQQGVLEWSDEPKTWWVFHEHEPLSERLIATLRASGHRVVSILAGDAFAAVAPATYTLAPDAGGAGYQELIDALYEAGLPPERILHTWLVTRDDSHRPGSSFFHRNQNFGFYSLFYLARALSKSGIAPGGTHLVLLANGVQRIAHELPEFPEKATVAGPCAVIPRELPGMTVSFVDIEHPTSNSPQRRRAGDRGAMAARLADDLAIELKALPATTSIAWRNGVRWQRRIVPERLPPESSPRLKHGGVYLITGGLGGIGGWLADWLAREHAAALVLVGRTPLPAREEWDDWLMQHDVGDSISRAILRIRALEALGSKVMAVAADVTVGDQMQAAVVQAEAQLGPIDGIFHAAGVMRDDLIPLKSQRDIEEVFSAKVYGTLVLDEIFRGRSLDFLFLFSSISAFTAPQGQIDYAGANAFLNAYADSRRGQRPYPVIAANWGIWCDVGMVAPTPLAGGTDLDAEIQRGTRQELDHPFFDVSYASRDGLLEVRVFEGRLSAERHWIIDEHRLVAGQALLPGTGFVELIRSALAALGEAEPWRIANLVFQRPLFVADGAPRAFRVRLRGGKGRWDAEVLAAGIGSSSGLWEVCATARVVAEVSAAAGQLATRDIEPRLRGASEHTAGSGVLRTSQEAHLRFGKHWRVLKRIDFGDGEAVARLELAESLRPELAAYALHPGLLDIATGCAMNLIPGYAEQDATENLWVPIAYRGIRYFGPLSGEIVSWLRLGSESRREAGFASFDVVVADADGRILVEVTGLTLRRLQGTLRASEFERAPESIESGEGGRVDTRRQKLSPSEQALQHNLALGIRPAEGIEVVSRLLRTELQPGIIVSSIRPPDLLRQADAVTEASMARSDSRFSRPELDSDFEAPRNDIEKGLADIWGKLLGVDGIGINDSFFDLGGHSLIAVRLFNELSDRYGVDLPMSVLMQRPTIAALAEIIGPTDQSAGVQSGPALRAGAPALEFRFVVPMHAGPVASGTPLFVVAGMFGNVLNLSHLAHLLGEERPFYAIQARGLYGDSAPHESFEEAAADYIAELRKVQPSGPYLIGGYSGGGITAYEMARQLIASGETVAGVILFDTPLPGILRFSRRDKWLMRIQRIRAGGWRYSRDKLAGKLAWLLRRREAGARSVASAQPGQVQFQSEKIGRAFIRSIETYRLQAAALDIFLFRPRLTVAYEISNGRKLTPNFQLALEDNGWGPHVRSVRVFEVPGDHDSMVLEPNVRVLVASLRRAIDRALTVK
jgi:thioesterase domain-containing protein/NAD(P)-dependent dehydrogenase (short-subunit alcohol dehydrogenase family)/acyl carrier protein